MQLNTNITPQDRISRAKELLATVRHAAMATVNEDGSPHNTPYFFMYDDTLQHLYWGSHPESQHSKNIVRTGQVFVVLYDGNALGGLYVAANNARATDGEELDSALAAHNTARKRYGEPPLPREYYNHSQQKMYAADIVGLWVNGAECDKNARVIRDYRQPITAKDLLAA
jgi:hypothetical protein